MITRRELLTWARLVTRHNAEWKRQHDPRGFVIEAIHAELDPAAAILAAALRQRPPSPRAVAMVALTDAEKADFESVMKAGESALKAGTVDEAGLVNEFRRRISPDRWSAAIAAAEKRIADDEALLKEYVAQTYVEKTSPRQTGRKPGRRDTPAKEWQIVRAYFAEIRRLEAARAVDDSVPRNVKTIAKKRIATKHGISISTLGRIVRGLHDDSTRQ